MGLTYFKRFRMEIDVATAKLPSFAPPPGYLLIPWKESLLEAHAEAKYQSFCLELDANVFPCLGELDGCRKLMREIASRDGFVSEATWLLGYRPEHHAAVEYCGTVQGVRDSNGFGAIQNLGITPPHRGQGLGTILMYAA
jgi:hypothetical protein